MIDPRNPDYRDTPVSPSRPRHTRTLDADVGADEAPAVSVITATCRAHRDFRETAASLLAQTVCAWEWLIVDDASDDAASRELIYDIAARDPRIRVLEHAENRGPGAARNTGAAKARAPYLYFLDDDDLIEPTALEKCLWYLDTHPQADLVNGWSLAFGEQEYLWRHGFDEGEAFLHDNWVTGRAMMRRSTFEAVRGFDESLREGFEDWDLWIRCARDGHWGGTIPEFMDWYRRRNDHSDRWQDWDGGRRKKRFAARLRAAHPMLSRGAFPTLAHPDRTPFALPDVTPPYRDTARSRERHVLFVLPWLTLGGSDKFNLDLVAGLRKRGFEISVATTLSGDSTWEMEFGRHTAEIFHLHHFLPLAERARFLVHMIRSRQPEAVVISHSELGYLLLPYLRAHCPDPLYLDYSHITEESWKGGGYPRMSIHAQPSLDLCLVSSEHLRGWMTERGARSDRIDVLHSNIDVRDWQPRQEARRRLRSHWSVDDDTTVILFSGRICAQKQPEVLARSAAELRSRGLDFLLVVVGDGEERAFLERLLNKRGLRECTRLLGAVPNETMRDLLSAADVFFLPSKWEGIALVLFEAMAMELPVVAARVGGQAELVDAKTGVLIERSDTASEVKAYADALERLIDDPDARRRMGRAARARVAESFRLDQMLDGFVHCIERARTARSERDDAPLDRTLAASWAAQAIEYLSVSELTETLWQAQPHVTSPDSTLGAQLHDAAWLDRVEGALSWRLMQRLHRGSLGRLAQRLGWASTTLADAEIASPSERRAAIERSHSYRLIRAVKSSALLRAYARMRHGRIVGRLP